MKHRETASKLLVFQHPSANVSHRVQDSEQTCNFDSETVRVRVLQWTRPWFLLIIVTALPGLGLRGSMELLLRRPADGRNAHTASWLDPGAEQNWWSWQERLEDVGPPKLRLFSASSRQHAPVLRVLFCGRGLNKLGGSRGPQCSLALLRERLPHHCWGRGRMVVVTDRSRQ